MVENASPRMLLCRSKISFHDMQLPQRHDQRPPGAWPDGLRS